MYPFIDIHTHFNKAFLNREGIAVYSHRIGIGEALPPSPFTAGIHPWDAEVVNRTEALDKLGKLHAIGIGEIGLDFACGVNKDIQETVLREQLQIAQSKVMPAVLHCVKATEVILKILNDYSLSSVIFHSFTGSAEQAAVILRQGYNISIGPRSLKSIKTLGVVSKIPVSKIFIETDDGSEKIADMYDKVAAIRNEPVGKIVEYCFKNYCSVFK